MSKDDRQVKIGGLQPAGGQPKMSASAGMDKLGTHSTTIALGKNRQPLDSFRNRNIPFDTSSIKEREKIRDWCRAYRVTDSLIPLLIEIYSNFPVMGLEFTHRDPELAEFHNQLFLDGLNYDQFLPELGREFFTVGEANSLAYFNDTLGVWESEEIINPNDVIVRASAITGEHEYRIKLPEQLQEVVRTGQPIWEYEQIRQNYPELIDIVNNGNSNRMFSGDNEDWESFPGIDVSNVLLSRMVNKVQPWDFYGTPHMVRCFTQLMLQESLNAAQDAIADRLYAPFVFAKLGGQVGKDDWWIPSQEDLNNFNQMMNAALAGDFRMLTYHYAADIKSVFGRESVPRFDQDYQRIENKILQTWGIGSDLINGGKSGTYASGALNREFVSQMMLSHQNQIKKHIRKRMLVVAEAKEHFDYNLSSGVRVPIYEEVLDVDPETGEEFIRKQPKLAIPDIKFASMNLRDEAVERQFMQTLKNMGVPISDQVLAAGMDFNVEEQREASLKEKIQKTVDEVKYKHDTYKILKEQGLPIPPELKDYDKPGEVEGAETVAVPDLSSASPTPNVAPQEGTDYSGEEESNPSEEGSESGDSALPKNRIRQRPAESDEQRKKMPKASTAKTGRLKEGPLVVGARTMLTPEEVSAAVTERSWTEEINPSRKKKSGGKTV